MKKILFLFAVITLSACQTAQTNYITYLGGKGLETAHVPERFQHCRGYGCRFIDDVSLDQDEWNEITSVFTPPAETPADERTKISFAIGNFEQIVGVKTGTDEDVHGTFMKLGDNQMDCVDESTNTTVYLSMLENAGLLHFHKLEQPNARWPLVHAGRWPHQTAVISETATGEHYVVDSWFFDNGAPAQVVDLKTWKDGWKPEEYR